MPKAIFTIDLQKPVTGKQVIEAVEAVINQKTTPRHNFEFVKEPLNHDGEVLYKVGQQSLFPSENLVVLAPDNDGCFNLERTYHKCTIRIQDHVWPGPREEYLLNCTQESVKKACEKFRNALQALLL